MERIYQAILGMGMAALAVTLSLAGLAGAQVKPANQALPKELSIYAGSKSCLECHGKFYQHWSTSRHGMAMQPYTPEFAQG